MPSCSPAARLQATAATEAFYLNNWPDLEATAQGLEQTAQYLNKATEVPDKQRGRLPTLAGDLAKEAKNLREVAGKKEVTQTNEALQRLTLKVRELRLDD